MVGAQVALTGIAGGRLELALEHAFPNLLVGCGRRYGLTQQQRAPVPLLGAAATSYGCPAASAAARQRRS